MYMCISMQCLGTSDNLPSPSLSLPLSQHAQAVPQVSSVPVYSTLAPLLLVLAVTAVKDAFDDIVSGSLLSTTVAQFLPG